MKLKILSPIIVCGLGTGAAAAHFLLAPAEVTEAAPEDRVDAVLALFEDTCLSHNGRNQFPRPRGLQRARMFPGDDRWYDVRSGMILVFRTNQCGISDILSHMTDAQMDQIVEQLPQFVTTRFPDLPQIEADLNRNPGILAWSMDRSDADAQTLLFYRGYNPTSLSIFYIAPE